jgi:hypothetical protein
MYQPRTPGYRKDNPEMRWALPERVFFACGACHILTYAFLRRWGQPYMRATWIKPNPGYIGNHIFVDGGDWAFDYHGYSAKAEFLAHTWLGARRRWPGWDATLVQLPPDVLISTEKSRTYEGLWLREPGQFLHDAMPRAKAYLDRFDVPPEF